MSKKGVEQKPSETAIFAALFTKLGVVGILKLTFRTLHTPLALIFRAAKEYQLIMDVSNCVIEGA